MKPQYDLPGYCEWLADRDWGLKTSDQYGRHEVEICEAMWVMFMGWDKQ